jgi:hypothetical protein
MKRKLNNIYLSDLYWCFGMLMTMILLIGHYVVSIHNGELENLFIWASVIVFILTLCISHIKKIRDRLNFEK